MKSKIRKSLDLLMAVFMIALMSYQATGNLFHEAAGVMLAVNIFVLFCMLTAM